jgi:hypothetical protein
MPLKGYWSAIIISGSEVVIVYDQDEEWTRDASFDDVARSDALRSNYSTKVLKD